MSGPHPIFGAILADHAAAQVAVAPRAKPTATPWQIKHDFDLDGRTTVIGNVDGEIVDGTTHHSYDFICDTFGLDADDSRSPEIAAANAAFIVRACNSHADLVALAYQYRNDLQFPVAPDSRQRRIEAIDRAIAKAEGRS